MRRRLGIYGATDETLRLIGQLTGSPRVEVVRVFDSDAAAAVERAHALSPELRDFMLLLAGERRLHESIERVKQIPDLQPVQIKLLLLFLFEFLLHSFQIGRAARMPQRLIYRKNL